MMSEMECGGPYLSGGLPDPPSSADAYGITGNTMLSFKTSQRRPGPEGNIGQN